MLDLHKKYLTEEFDAYGKLLNYKLNAPDDFNFAYDVIDKLGMETPDRRAMRWVDDNGNRTDLTFADIKRGSNRAASFFQERGIGRGDRVMLILRRNYQFWFAILGLHKIGAVAIPATYQLLKEDIMYRLEIADVKAILCTDYGPISGEVDAAVEEYEKPVAKIMVGDSHADWLNFDLGLSVAPDFETLEGEDRAGGQDLMLLYFTSGTEGNPKMVAHNHTYPIAHIPTAKYWQKVDPDGLHLSVSDTGWAKSVWGKIYGQWLMEAGVYVYDFAIFNPARMLKRIQADEVTTLCAPPTTFRYLTQEIDANPGDYDLSNLQHLTTAGEALMPEVFNDVKRITGLEIKEGFGQTETVLSCYTPYWLNSKIGSMGIAMDTYEVVLLDGAGNELPYGSTGEICVKADRDNPPIGVFSGYLGDEAEQVMDNIWYDGYYHTRDEASTDEEGYFYYVGRLDDMIKTSGFRVGPFEVESVILEHPAVLECAVTGLPDKNRGQIIKATIILKDGYTASRELERDIKKFARVRTATYKSPRVIEFAADLPKTVSGKVRRKAIRAQDNGETKAE